MTPKRILIADDEPLYRETTAEFLREEGYECVCVEDAEDASTVAAEHSFDLILTDLNMPGNLKLEWLHEGRTRHSQIPMIVVTGVPSIPSAIESIRLGITDYLLKPVKFEELLAAVEKALSSAARQTWATASVESTNPGRYPSTGETTFNDNLANESPANNSLANNSLDGEATSSVIGSCESMAEIKRIVQKIASSNTNVLITGESGTGKEVIARLIHRLSDRANHTFQVIDCTAIPESLFESVLFGHVQGAFTGAVRDQTGLLRASDGGTAFLDELGELPAASQAKLLRLIQEQTFTPVGETESIRVDTRFVCATNRDIHAEVESGQFRRDLYYRLAVIHLELPPLRERGDDITLLANHFLKLLRPKDSNVKSFAESTVQCFHHYRWPGNIRELRNVVERSIALAQSNVIEPHDLPRPLREPSVSESLSVAELAEVSRDEALDTADRTYLKTLLSKHRGVIASAARQAGLSRQGMNKLLKRHGIDANEFRQTTDF
ncbi:sigma-54 dependent transcriptional regulator [Rhodopirellula sp. JC740]|uniref:Sigma-54 dependent transcriptional regulator n=1 Tax=Rhodopirellula halodulae TaxID=2894198 RepID=A0ABS8NND5_9BACT|nr:sigma-54 dependent transcriptional regulator [Rhodopirellula sp. JC740]MCC9645109.1 sigma-54 dependent transcriptional regulator [Rhodopirellula sp. JC740]